MRLLIVSVLMMLLIIPAAYCQSTIGDTSHQPSIDSVLQKIAITQKSKSYDSMIKELLSANKFINYTNNAEPVLNVVRKNNGKEWLFYLLSADILLLGVFKAFYSKYFNNIFRVFFNTSLRQNQLTDILLQARLPSLIFNLFFIFNGGIFLYLVLSNYLSPASGISILFPAICIASLGVIYIAKYFTLKIIGWITGMTEPADTYIFVIFLINKIIGIILIPFIVLIAFAPLQWQKGLTFLSLAIILLLFLLRFYRSYGLLENQFALNRFHFFIYVVALEIVPVLILYKIAMQAVPFL
jgi:hypothetical protein